MSNSLDRVECSTAVPDADDDGKFPRRSGTLWTASAYIITAVIGTGVLSLPWSMAQLGWTTGSITMAIFALITYMSATFLADSYRSPCSNGLDGPSRRNYTYKEAVHSHLGNPQTKLCALAQYAIMIGSNIGYTITASLSIRALVKSTCLQSGKTSSCHNISTTPSILIFGALQLLLSQIPDLSKLAWVLIIAATMSTSYTTLATILGLIKLIGDGGHLHGTSGGLLLSSFSKGHGFHLSNLWLGLQAIGNMAFAFTYTFVLVEIQDTLKSPPSEIKVMKRANAIGISATTIFYFLCSCIGYAAFGEHAPGNIITGFGYSKVYWLVDIANVFVIVYLVASYQIFSQPFFAFFEDWTTKTWPNLKRFHQGHEIKFCARKCEVSLLRLIFRSIFIVVVTIIAMVVPFFNDILGIVGALTFWPLTVYFPIKMHIIMSKTSKWTMKWCLLHGISFLSFAISLMVLIGSIQGALVDLKLL